MRPFVKPRQRIFTFPTIIGSPELQNTTPLPSMYMRPTSGLEGGTMPCSQGTPEAPSTQNLSHLTSVFGSNLPSTQLISQLPSVFSPSSILGRTPTPGNVSMPLPTQQQPFLPIEASSPISPCASTPSGPYPPSNMVPSWDSYGGLQLPPPVSDPFSQFSTSLFSGSDSGRSPLPAMPSMSPMNLSRHVCFPGDVYGLGGDSYQAPYSPGQFSPYSPSGTFSQLDPCSPLTPASSPGGSPFFQLAPDSFPSTASSPYSSLGACSPFRVVPPASSPDTSSLYGPMFPASYVSSIYGPMVSASPTYGGSPLFSSGPSSLFSPVGVASSPGTICVPSPIQFSPLIASSPRPITPPMGQPASPESAEKSDRRAQATAMGRDSKTATFERIVGEIAFQLDRRILSSIFPDRVRLYGFTVGNIPEKIMQAENDTVNPLTAEQRTAMMDRYNEIMNRLKPHNYNPSYHPQFTEHIVNTYGILRERPDATGSEAQLYNDLTYLNEVIVSVVPQDKVADCLILLNCLRQLSQADGKPLFIW
ncbi:speriolin-like [Thamnophis elegans]|uniref:speriolin-like n=1 Tax=Thamnophis elegans TaxID=35005 RepID=UPI0013781E64|nr:speriolin-like [Thamnophis elegans]